MKPSAGLPPSQAFTMLFAAWTVFIYLVLFAVKLTHRMLPHGELQILIFGPAILGLIVFVIYAVQLQRRNTRLHREE